MSLHVFSVRADPVSKVIYLTYPSLASASSGVRINFSKNSKKSAKVFLMLPNRSTAIQ